MEADASEAGPVEEAAEVPLDVDVTDAADGPHEALFMADAGSCPVIGAAPKAVTWHGLKLEHGPDGWTCSVTLDV
ncbi:hypothetical protein [Streptomyces sp. NPDC019507]|uniref:hypothetical protein n=1 Tax=Streptomyces sp. NPDC019507 TaxID=3154689 RepID=UPI0033DE6196